MVGFDDMETSQAITMPVARRSGKLREHTRTRRANRAMHQTGAVKTTGGAGAATRCEKFLPGKDRTVRQRNAASAPRPARQIGPERENRRGNPLALRERLTWRLTEDPDAERSGQ